jgi:type I restriction enzyme M protein
VRKELLEQFKLHTILSLPAGCFLPYTGVKTNVIFFDRPDDGSGTESIWYYELTNDGFELKQTRKPIAGNQLPDFLTKWQGRVQSENSWTVTVTEIVSKGYDLTAKNPNKIGDYEHRAPRELVQSIKTHEARITELLDELDSLLEGGA